MSKIINDLLRASAALLFFSMPICAQNGGAAAASTAATTTTADKTFLPIKEETVFYSTAVLLGLNFGDLEVETRDAGDDWEIVQTARFPDGVVSDTAIVDKKTLRLKRAITREFEKTVEYEIKDGKLSGTETDGKKSKTFTLETGGADVYNTRAFSFALYKMLPLAKDFKTRLKIFNPKDKRIEEIDFKVAGEEILSLDNGSGDFDCYRIDAISTEDRKGKYTIWVERMTGRIVKLKGSNGIFRGEMQLQTKRRNIRL